MLVKRPKTLVPIPLIVGFVAILAFSQSGASAQDVEQLTMIVNSNICPSELSTYTIVSGNERCNPDQRNTKLCDRQFSPGGKEWEACYQEVFKCYRQVDEINKKIYAYNAFIYKCRAAHPDRPKQQATSLRPSGSSSPSGGLSRAVEAEKKRAEDARNAARDAVTKAAQKRSEEDVEKQRLKQLTNAPSSSCQNAIAACEQRASSLRHSKSETQSQCRAYCQLLQIENCNPSSTNIQQAAQACTAGAERDKKAAAERVRAEKAAEAARDPYSHLRCTRQGSGRVCWDTSLRGGNCQCVGLAAGISTMHCAADHEASHSPSHVCPGF
jgi:hypothetical protein